MVVLHLCPCWRCWCGSKLTHKSLVELRLKYVGEKKIEYLAGNSLEFATCDITKESNRYTKRLVYVSKKRWCVCKP